MLNFIISNSPEIWMKNSKKLFIADPYVYHVLERTQKNKQYDSIQVSDYLRNTKEDLIDDSNFVDEKYEKYIEILSNRLNEIHNKNYELDFWKKSLSMGFIRYITAFYDTFKICEKYFNPELHSCNVLSKTSYFTPNDFEDHRACFQNSDFGQEQIFSIYMHLFHSGLTNPTDLDFSVNKNKKINWTEKIRKSKVFFLLKSLFYKFKYGFFLKKIKIGVLGSYFSKKNINELSRRSSKKIALINIPEYSYSGVKNKALNIFERELLSNYENDFDAFDKFFFASLKYCFPKIFIEDYENIEIFLKNKIGKYPQLDYVTCENWISNTQNSLCIALFQSKSIKHINNEHNCFFHPFAGSFVNHVLEMCDIYATLGWNDYSSPKLIRSGSLFAYNELKTNKIINKILFVAAPSIVKATHFSGAWGYAQENVPKTITFNNCFFENLSKSTLSEILYRGYPKYKTHNIQMYIKEYFYNDFYAELKLSDYKKSGKQEMAESQLIVIDYISTAYLESILLNLPTVFFWDVNAYFLDNKNKDFFQPLINVGICQTDPVKAARFIEKIKDNPKKWWLSEVVQKGKNEFLEKNIGEPEKMINYLLGLL